jgi:dCTP deaminase
MILSDRFIKSAMDKGDIVIIPFFDSIGSNTIDLHLSPHLFRYSSVELDAAKDNSGESFLIPDEGFVLQPGELYLGSTLEWTSAGKYVPMLEGKSSIGRLGICVHITAGVGDIGFQGHWTLEIACIKPVRIYAGMPIAQLLYFIAGKCDEKYNIKHNSKYTIQSSTCEPINSGMFRNFPLKPDVLNYIDAMK